MDETGARLENIPHKGKIPYFPRTLTHGCKLFIGEPGIHVEQQKALLASAVICVSFIHNVFRL
jgi:hypothetical protein